MDVHIVQKGDTLWKISRQHGISFEELKRVNAHLANPDYIVPGMKIFLPKSKPQSGGTQPPPQQQPTGQKPKVEKESTPKPAPPHREVEVQKEPIPLPTGPKPPTITSKPTPPKEEKPKEPQKLPIAPENNSPAPNVQQPFPQMVPVQPYPMIGIPCGWFPVYDADCYPYMHPGQLRPVPTPQPGPFPGQERPTPPCNPATRPRNEAQPSPQPTPVSPNLPRPQVQEPMLSTPHQMPDIEAPSQLVSPPRGEQKPVKLPEPTENRPQTLEEPPRHHFPYEMPQQQPAFPGQPMPCGCQQQFNPMPQPPPMQSFCASCHQPMQQHPMFYPMPRPWQGQ